MNFKRSFFVWWLFCLVAVSALTQSITDATGVTVKLPADIKRIVAVVPSDAEMLFDLGLGDKLVGVNDWAAYPKEVLEIEKIGGSPLSVEKIIALKPDIVLANVGFAPKEIALMRDLGLVVLAINPTDLASTLETYLLVGKAFNREKTALTLVKSLEERQAKLKPLAKKPKVFVEIWHDPLMTAGKGSLWDSLILTAGGENIGAYAQGSYPVFNEEELIKQNPDFILLTNYNLEEAQNRPVYAALKKKLLQIDPGLFTYPTQRLWDGLEVLYEIFCQKQ